MRGRPVLCWSAQGDAAKAEMIDVFLKYASSKRPHPQPFTSTANKKQRQWRTSPFEVTRNRLAIIGRSHAQTCNEALVGSLPETAVWLDRKWLRSDQSQRCAAAAPLRRRGMLRLRTLFRSSSKREANDDIRKLQTGQRLIAGKLVLHRNKEILFQI